MRDDKENVIIDLTFKFAIGIINYSDELEGQKKYVLARQLLKSDTSIGANSSEAQNAESKADFIHKFKIAAKEADETEYWLMLCKASKDYPNPDSLLKEITSYHKDNFQDNIIGKRINVRPSFSNFQIA